MRVAPHLRLILFLAVGLAVAGAPLLHTHPLLTVTGDHHSISSAGASPCAVCATGTARAITVPPVLVVPDAVPRTLVCSVASFAGVESVLARVSRAPPTA